MIVDPDIFDWHAFQCTAARRFLRRGDDVAAIKTFERIAAIVASLVFGEVRV